MVQESIEFIFLFKGPIINTASIVNYFDKFHENLYASNLQEISYSVKSGNSVKGKSLKFNSKNIEKLIRSNPSGGFDLFSLLPDWTYKSKDIKFLVAYTPNFNDENGSLILTINKDFFFKIFNNKKLVEIYLDIAKYLNNNMVEMTYGFIFSLSNDKFPALFVQGIGNYNLTNNEDVKLRAWANKNNESSFKIWDIFWGNLITLNHLQTPGFIQSIKKIVGADNFYIINDLTYFFNLPDNSLSFDNEERIESKELLKLFKKLKE